MKIITANSGLFARFLIDSYHEWLEEEVAGRATAVVEALDNGGFFTARIDSENVLNLSIELEALDEVIENGAFLDYIILTALAMDAERKNLVAEREANPP